LVVTSNETIAELVGRHVLRAEEYLTRATSWPDGIALTTNLRHFVAGSEPADWAVSREPWVEDVVIAIRDDLIVEGQPERFGFLLLKGGGEIYLNDEAAVAQLGHRLADGMDPTGYAQIIVAFHPYSSAHRGVVTEVDGLRGALGQPDLPDVEPLQLHSSPEGLTLTFTSFARYTRPGGFPMVDLLRWRVEVPPGEPARWSSATIAAGLRLDPSDRLRQGLTADPPQGEVDPWASLTMKTDPTAGTQQQAD
jgi:hypothetical protein